MSSHCSVREKSEIKELARLAPSGPSKGLTSFLTSGGTDNPWCSLPCRYFALQSLPQSHTGILPCALYLCPNFPSSYEDTSRSGLKAHPHPGMTSSQRDECKEHCFQIKSHSPGPAWRELGWRVCALQSLHSCLTL